LVRPALLVLALVCIADAAAAQLPALSAQLGKAEADLRAVDRALDTRVDDQQRQALRNQALAAQGAAADATRQLGTQLTLVDAKIAGLGLVAPGVVEAPDIRAQRALLAQQRSAIDSGIKRGGLLGVEARQLVDEIEQSQAAQFGEKISTRVPSPLAPAFWRAVIHALPRDLRRIDAFVRHGVDQIRAQRRDGFPAVALAGVLLALVILFPGRVMVRRIGQRLLVEGAPGRRVRRSAYAMWRVLVGTASPALAVAAAMQGLQWSGLLPASWAGLLDALIVAAGFSGFTASVTGALLLRNQPSWRVSPISDAVAARLRPFSWALAALALASFMLDAFNGAVAASAAAQVATQTIEALLHLLLIGGTLLAIGRLRAAQADRDDAASMPTEPGSAFGSGVGLGAVTLLAWLLAAGALVALLIGYVGLSLFVVRMVAWAAVVGAGVYLVMTAIDDVATTVFTHTSPLGRTLTHGLGLRGSAIDQFGVLLSGVLRVVLALLALGLLLMPFGGGNGIGAVFGRLGVLAQGIEVGGVTVSPGAILRGIVVLFIGMALVRGFMGWLEGRYLPATDLDGSGRNSVSLVARYVGVGLAVIWALASLGIGMERIALLLSALSVGIGFGLQAITQNFVSGLILLAERPIKIGDLVRVGTDEGDVRRISVRSTEIELADHSTLIVPNSELITKSVLNRTLAAALGRIQIQFSVPIGADADRVRRIVLDAFAAEADILQDPAPAVFVDGLTDGRILFNCFAHVPTARAAYGARSNVFMMLLSRFREEGVEIGTVPQKLELVAPPAASERIDPSPPRS
jgi:potassium efflux system protein